MRFHDLRHTAATVLLGRGVNPKVVGEMLGHSHFSITLRRYGHLTPHMQRYTADMMDRFRRLAQPTGINQGVKLALPSI
jgi:integrase